MPRLAPQSSPLPSLFWQCVLLSQEQFNKTKHQPSNGVISKAHERSEATWRLEGEVDHPATLHSNEGSYPPVT